MNDCWVYTLTHNSERFLPHFLRHYKGASRIVIYDNGSTDHTLEILSNQPQVEVQPYQQLSGNELRDDIHASIKNNCWKEARSHVPWVIVCDCDELLYHPQLEQQLAHYREAGITVPLTTGYEMVSLSEPEELTHITHGVRNDFYSKLLIFNPEAVREINYGPGGHYPRPVGRIIYSEEPCQELHPVPPYPSSIRQLFVNDEGYLPPANDLKVLHCRFLGQKYLEKLWADYRQRVSTYNQQLGLGRQYYLPVEEQERVFQLLLRDASLVVKE